MEGNRILVSWDKDFNDQRFQQDRFRRLSRVGLSGAGPDLVKAMRQHMRIVEFQWSEVLRTGAPRMIVAVKLGQVKFRA